MRRTSLLGSIAVSVALHVGLLLAVWGGRSQQEMGGVAQPPVLSVSLVTGLNDGGLSTMSDAPAGSTPPPNPYLGLIERNVRPTVPSFTTIIGQDIVSVELDLERYLPPSQLTDKPGLLKSIEPVPTHMAFPRVVGELELMILLSSEGSVDHVFLLQNSLPGPIVELAVESIRGARYRPGRLEGMPVPSRYRIKLSMGMPEDREAVGGAKALPNAHYLAKPQGNRTNATVVNRQNRH